MVTVVALCVTLGACGTGQGRTRELRLVHSALLRAGAEPRTFTYTEQLLDSGKTVVVDGEVQDDLRSAETLSINAKPVLQQVISDDAIAMRVLDTNGGAPFIAAVKRQSKDAATALTDGKWVLDHQGAPPLVAAHTAAGTIAVGLNPLDDAGVYAFQYFNSALDGASQVVQFNPDSIEYNPLDDPWRADVNRDLAGEGIRRYDTAQAPLPRPAQRGTRQQLPGTFQFRKMVVYMKGQNVLGVNEQIKISDRAEFRRAKAGRAAKFYLTQLAAALNGATRDPIRQRVLRYTMQPKDVSVSLPIDNVMAVPKMDLVTAVSALFPEAQRRNAPGSSVPQATRPPSASS